MEDSVQDKAISSECFTFESEQIHSRNSQDISMEESQPQLGGKVGRGGVFKWRLQVRRRG